MSPAEIRIERLVRIPASLDIAIKALATDAHRSHNAEIVMALEDRVNRELDLEADEETHRTEYRSTTRGGRDARDERIHEGQDDDNGGEGRGR